MLINEQTCKTTGKLRGKWSCYSRRCLRKSCRCYLRDEDRGKPSVGYRGGRGVECADRR